MPTLNLKKLDVSKWSWQTWIRVALPIAIAASFVIRRVFLTPDELFLILFVVFLTYGLALEFIKRFLPFLALLVSYDALRGLVPFVSKHVHFTTMIDFDKFIGFGQLPTERLQHIMYHGHLHWYDFYFYSLYMMHFVTPVLLGVLLWRRRPHAYWSFVWSLVLLSYAAFITYIAFPAAPPWMASEMHLIPTIEKLSTDIFFAIGVHDFPTLYAKLSPNQVAAVPSLHSAYPMLFALTIFKQFGRKWGLASLLYPFSMWLGVVYMGEHYVFDVLFGILYAFAAFIGAPYFMRFMTRHIPYFRNRQAVAQPASATSQPS